MAGHGVRKPIPWYCRAIGLNKVFEDVSDIEFSCKGKVRAVAIKDRLRGTLIAYVVGVPG